MDEEIIPVEDPAEDNYELKDPVDGNEEIEEKEEVKDKKEEVKESKYLKNGRLKSINRVAKLLAKEDTFKNILMRPSLNLNYIYREKEGFYEAVTPDFIERVIYETLEKQEVYLESIQIKRIYNQLTLRKEY
jgi:hypothetical protein